MIILLASLSLLSATHNFAQQAPPSAKTNNQKEEEKIRKLIENLPANNMLKQSLEGGRRGDDVHQPWMDTMVRLGIKQVVFRIRYAGCNKGTALKIENTRYLSSYYDDDSRIKKKAILRQVKDTGLEKALADAILSRAEALVSYDKERLKTDPTMRELNSSELCGTMFLNLLDDEMLPVSDEPGIIDSGCGRHC